MRVHVLVPLPVQVQPGPDAAVAVNPDGSGSRTVTVSPSVGVSPSFVTVRVTVFPTSPCVKVEGLGVADRVSGPSSNTHGSGSMSSVPNSSRWYGTGFASGGIRLFEET